MFVLSTIPAIPTIDQFGRRPLLIIGGAGMATCLILCASLVASLQNDWQNHHSAAWSTAAFIWLYVGFFGGIWGPVTWTVISEVFPLSFRSHGVALGAATNWMTDFIVSIIA